MAIEPETIKKLSYFVLLASYIAASVLAIMGEEKFDNSLKPLLEGLTFAVAFLVLVNCIFIFTKRNFKNNLIFLIINIVICALSIGIIVIYARDEKQNKTDGKNITFLSLIGVAVFLSFMVLLNDVLNSSIQINIGKSKT